MIPYIIKNGSWIFVGNVLLALFAFATTAALTNLLPKETFGTYRFILAVIPVLAVFTLPDMGQAITRAVAKGQNIDLLTIVREKIKYGLVGSVGALSAATWYFVHGNSELGTLFVTTAVFIPFFDAFLIYMPALYGIKAFRQAVGYQVVSRLITMFVLIAVAVITTNILFVLAAYFITQLIPQCFYFLHVRRNKFNRADISHEEIVRYGKHLTIIGTAAVITANIDKLIVWHLLGAEMLAVYIVALLIALEGGRLMEAASSVLLPFLSEARDHTNIRTLLRSLPILTILLTVGAVAAAFIIPYLFPLVFPAYSDAVRLAQMSCALLVLIPLNSLLYRYFVAETWRFRMIVLQILKLIAFLLVCAFTFSTFSLNDALTALIVSEFAASCYLLIMIVRHINQPTSTAGTIRTLKERRLSRKIIVGRLNRHLPFLRPLINYTRFVTFPQYCSNYPLPSASYSDGPWIERNVTKDQRAIEQYLTPRLDITTKLLHVGVGSSSIAKQWHTFVSQIDGITIVNDEKVYADSLEFSNYYVSLTNKNDVKNLGKLSGHYNYIIDNDIAAYSCCKQHFEDMLRTYHSLLDPAGQVLAGAISITYFDSGFPPPYQYLETLAQQIGFTTTKQNGVICFQKQ